MKREINTRLRRARRIRRKIIGLQADRLCVHRTPRHIYAQIIDKTGGKVLASASTVEADVRGQIKHGGNVEAAQLIGKRIAEKAKALPLKFFVFDVLLLDGKDYTESPYSKRRKVLKQAFGFVNFSRVRV